MTILIAGKFWRFVTVVKAWLPVWSLKLSNHGWGRYIDGWPCTRRLQSMDFFLEDWNPWTFLAYIQNRSTGGSRNSCVLVSDERLRFLQHKKCEAVCIMVYFQPKSWFKYFIIFPLIHSRKGLSIGRQYVPDFSLTMQLEFFLSWIIVFKIRLLVRCRVSKNSGICLHQSDSDPGGCSSPTAVTVWQQSLPSKVVLHDQRKNRWTLRYLCCQFSVRSTSFPVLCFCFVLLPPAYAVEVMFS